MDMQKLADKINKLLAKANGTENEVEAALFAEKARAMMLEHDIDPDVILAAPAVARIEDKEWLGMSESWVRLIFTELAPVYLCGYYFMTAQIDNHSIDRHCFVGQAHHIAVVKSMGKYLTDTVARLADQHIANKPGGLRYSAERSFKNAAAIRLASRLRGMCEPETLQTVGDCINVPAVIDKYQAAKQEFRDYMKDQGAVSVPRYVGMSDEVAMQAGFRAADDIGLGQQITKQDQDKLS